MKKAVVPFVVLLIVAAIVYFAIIPSTPEASKKLQQEIQTVMSSGKAVFLQISSTGCVTCRKMKPEVEKLSAQYAQNAQVAIINIDADANKSLAASYSITGVPTQIMLAPSGKELFRNMGYMSLDNMNYVITKFLH